MEEYYIEVCYNGFKKLFRTNSNDIKELLEIYSSFFNVSKSELEIRFITKEEYMESEDYFLY